ncbi:MAG: fibronectin type III domain-containing protein [Treponema sp.]|nr:fibronectin type III domain-containing protein [Treponema sp.]
MKRFFTILFSLAALVSVCVFVSCNADSSEGGGLSAPQNVTAEATSSASIKVSWNPVSNATGYEVYYSEYSSISYASLLDNTTSTSTTATGLKANTKYYFWVKAANSTTTSDYSSYAYATTKFLAPTGLTATAASLSSIKLSWNSVSGATEYQVYYSEDSSISNASLLCTTTPTSTSTSTFTTAIGLKENTTYYFWVKAANSTTTSDYSSYAYATTICSPTGLIATAASSSSIKLSWNSVSSATTYYVYKSESSSSSTASVVSAVTSTSTTVTGLKANTKYYFWVKAATNTTISDYSSYDYATTNTAIASWTPPTTYQELTNLGAENAIGRNVSAGNVYWFRLYAPQPSSSQYTYTIFFEDKDDWLFNFTSDVVATYYNQTGTVYASDVDNGMYGRSCSYYLSQYLYVKVECKQSGSFAIYAERTKK